MHPMAIEGGVEETVLRFIVRSFDAARSPPRRRCCSAWRTRWRREPRARVTVEIARSYRNMKEYLAPTAGPDAAEEAVRRAGLRPRRGFIRGARTAPG